MASYFINMVDIALNHCRLVYMYRMTVCVNQCHYDPYISWEDKLEPGFPVAVEAFEEASLKAKV